MTPYFAGQPITAIAFGVTIGSWVLLELRQSLHRRPGAARRDHGSYYLLIMCVAAGWIATAASIKISGATIHDEPTPFIIGLLMVWVGIGLRAWAFHSLGEYFTFRVKTSADQVVIASGPYRTLRHPSYTGIALILIGVSLLYGTWIGLATMMVLPTAGLVNRIYIEERALDAELGSAYRNYAAGRRRLIPYLW